MGNVCYIILSQWVRYITSDLVAKLPFIIVSFTFRITSIIGASLEIIEMPIPSNEPRVSFFLLLPSEIRQAIYEEILLVDRQTTYPPLLYHDTHGLNPELPQGGCFRSTFTQILLSLVLRHVYCLNAFLRLEMLTLKFTVAQILRVNKQINHEATSLLYEQKRFLIDLTSPIDVSCVRPRNEPIPPRALFRHNPDSPSSRHFRQPGIFDPYIFKRLANLEIITSSNAIWVNAMMGDFFSHAGELFLEILRVLADEEESGTRKRLQITIHKEFFNGSGMLMFPMSDGKRGFRNNSRKKSRGKLKAVETCQLIEAIGKRRKVTVVEHKKDTTYNVGRENDVTWHVREVPSSELQDL